LRIQITLKERGLTAFYWPLSSNIAAFSMNGILFDELFVFDDISIRQNVLCR